MIAKERRKNGNQKIRKKPKPTKRGRNLKRSKPETPSPWKITSFRGRKIKVQRSTKEGSPTKPLLKRRKRRKSHPKA